MTPFYRFTLRFLAAVLLGLLLLALPAGGPLQAVVPQRLEAWQLGKLAFWPLLAESALLALWERRPLSRDCPLIVLTTLALAVSSWGALALGDRGRLCLALWISLLAAGLAVPPEPGRRPRLWVGLTILLAAVYAVPQWR